MHCTRLLKLWSNWPSVPRSIHVSSVSTSPTLYRWSISGVEEDDVYVVLMSLTTSMAGEIEQLPRQWVSCLDCLPSEQERSRAGY